jgi:cobalt/nickel transport protein
MVIPFLMPHANGQGSFAGSDGQAAKLIAESHADYTPWRGPLWKPPSSEIESLLFGLQAALGAGLLGYCLGFYRARRLSGAQTKSP